MPEVRDGRIRGAAGEEGPSQSFLRLQPVSGVRFHNAAQADCRTLSEVRRSVYRGEAHEDGKRKDLHQGRLRLGDRRARIGTEGSGTGRGRRLRQAVRTWNWNERDILRRSAKFGT